MNAGRPANTPEVLWSKVEKRGPDECWPWKGFRNTQGYGRTWIGDRGYYAHRVIFNLAHPGVIDIAGPTTQNDYGFLLHRCDNPSCCNPAHLYVGTHLDNMRDKKQKGRCPDFKGQRGPCSKLTNEQAEEIRWIASKGIAASEIARIYGVSKPTIQSVIVKRHYYA